MKENINNEKLLSRRGFFKNAAKKALPIFAVISLGLTTQSLLVKTISKKVMIAQKGVKEGVVAVAKEGVRVVAWAVKVLAKVFQMRWFGTVLTVLLTKNATKNVIANH